MSGWEMKRGEIWLSCCENTCTPARLFSSSKDNRRSSSEKRNHSLAISLQEWYIACMNNQHTTPVPSEESQKTRERIIAAASKVEAEKGYDATTLREISREARAAPGLVDYYFGGKDELLVELLQA